MKSKTDPQSCSRLPDDRFRWHETSELPVRAKLLVLFSRSWPFERGRTRFRHLIQLLLRGAKQYVTISLRKSDVKLSVPWQDYSGSTLVAFGDNDTSLSNFILCCLQTQIEDDSQHLGPSTFVDIGANLGAFSLRVAEQTMAQVIAFEPHPALSKLLEENVRLNGYSQRIEIRPFALGDAEGICYLEFSPGDTGRTRVGAFSSNGCTVVESTLAREFSPEAWSRVKILKIDVEGFEIGVIEGGSQLFANHRPIIVFEVNIDELAGRGKSPRDLGDIFRRLGYTDFAVLDKVLYPLDNGAYKVSNIVAFPINGHPIKEKYGFANRFCPHDQRMWPVVYYDF